MEKLMGSSMRSCGNRFSVCYNLRRMTRLPITTGVKNPILRAVSPKVKKVDKALLKLIHQMYDTLIDEEGLGIAAPQVGVNLHMALARLNYGTPNEVVMTLINPEILSLSGDMIEADEGCLSIPKIFYPTKRYCEVTVAFSDEKGKKYTLHLKDLNARVIQHEVDHLNGILYVDHLDPDVLLKGGGKERKKK